MRLSNPLSVLFIPVLHAACDAPPSAEQPFNAAAAAAEADLEAACAGLVARIPDGASRPVASEQVYAPGPSSGYSVTEFRLRMGPGGALVPRFATKIWQKDDSGWQIVHVHESVARLSP